MLSVKSLGSFVIADRGTVFTFASPVECERGAAMSVFGPEIEIDGIRYRVKGIEMHMLPSNTLIRVGAGVGVLV